MSESASVSRDEILDRVSTIFKNELDDESIHLKLEDNTDTVDGWDSLAHVRIITSVESEFDLQFDVAEIEKATSVLFIVSAVESRLG
jgi:acyl carrier protein